MKKFYFYVFVTIAVFFTACKDDGITVTDQGNEFDSGTTPDVYVENGYLAFKDLNTVDSVLHVFSQMTRDGKDAWDTQMGFTSARSEFEKLFDEYEQLASRDEFLTFKEKYKDQLTFNETDEDDNSIDYPFFPTPLAPLLNTEGTVKIGKSLFQYTKSGRIAVYDGDLHKLKNFEQFRGDKMVELLTQTQTQTGIKTRSTETTMIDDFADDNPTGSINRWWRFGKKRLTNELMVEKWRIWYADNEWHRQNRYFFRQRGQKKSVLGWNDYRTEYWFYNLYLKIGSDATRYGAGDTSSELQTATVNLYTSPLNVINYPNDQTPSYLGLSAISFKCEVGFRGTSEGPFPIIHQEHSTFPGSNWIEENFGYN